MVMNCEWKEAGNQQEDFLRKWIEVGDKEDNMVDRFYDYYIVFNFLFEQYSQEHVDSYCAFAKKEFEKEEEEERKKEERKMKRNNSNDGRYSGDKYIGGQNEKKRRECNFNREGYKLKFFLNSLCEPLLKNGFCPRDILIEEPAMVNTPVKKMKTFYKVDDKGRPCFTTNNSSCERIKLFDGKDRDKEMVLAIFDNIYGIRCNLFHGSKVKDCFERNGRDIKLITSASSILKSMLESFMKLQFDTE